MKKSRLKFSLYLSCFVFSILFNSVTFVIKQSIIHYVEDDSSAAILRLLEDASLAGVAFLAAPFMPRLGYRRSMLFSLGALCALCLVVPLSKSFMIPKLLFVVVGAGSALVHISAFSILGMLARDEKEYKSEMNFLAAAFALGAAFSLMLFHGFLHLSATDWRYAFWVIASLSAFAFYMLYTSPLQYLERKYIDKEPLRIKSIYEMLHMLTYTLVIMFGLGLIFITFTEKQFEKWLPAFSAQIIRINESMANELLITVLLSIATGAVLAGFVVRKMGTLSLLVLAMLAAICTVIVLTEQTQVINFSHYESWSYVPIVVGLVPMMGFFWAPVVPTLYAVVLANVQTSQQSNMSGLLIVMTMACRALAGQFSGYIFTSFNVPVAFYFSIVSVTLLGGIVFLFITDLKSSR